MPTVPLPEEPRLDQLRNQARELQRAVRAGRPEAIAEVAEQHPEADPAPAVSFRLSTAQLVVARRYGFASWTRLKRHVEAVGRYSRFPARMAAGEPGDLADRFLRLACLSYDDVGPAQWAEAQALLVDHPKIVDGNAYVASAAGDADTLGRVLTADPGAARRQGGPYRWDPLLYLAYARHDPAIPGDAVADTARLLLGAGADPDAGFLWHGLLSPFTALTGLFGEGEQGPTRQPRHPHALALARLLLEAGADPNDSQALYNRMFEPDDDHLVLLFEFGLGTDRGGPWRARLGDGIEPAALVRSQLPWAISHGIAGRVRLLAGHGVDLAAPFGDGTTPTAMAATTGHPELVRLLVDLGAPSPALTPDDALVAAMLAVDRDAIGRLRGDHPGIVERIRSERPGLVPWAAATGRPGAVELLVGLGFDVDAKGRTDMPSNQPWQTGLHKAVEDGDIELARTFLQLGADPDIKDMRFDGTPLDWAHHFGHQDLVELLEPVTGLDA